MRTLTLSALVPVLRQPSKGSEIVDTGSVAETGDPVIDTDADGYDETEDCDDANSVVNPGAEEICDGIDNNCDGQVDEGGDLHLLRRR